jgi:hypothetical protein
MEFISIKQAKELTGLSYIGNLNHSSKHEKAYKYDELVYTIYLAPAKLSGYEVCPMRSEECTRLCLNESGHNRIDIHQNRINISRIKKTKLFFENRDFFVRWMFEEIKLGEIKAKKLNYKFSVRLNNTSDISPESFYIDINGKKINVLQYFQHIQFYDYTKVANRFDLTKKYKNYDLTFSYSGTNMVECLNMLNKKVRVAMVFNTIPEMYLNYKVVPGDDYDMRYYDEKNIIVGLKYKKVRNKLPENTKFVIQL